MNKFSHSESDYWKSIRAIGLLKKLAKHSEYCDDLTLIRPLQRLYQTTTDLKTRESIVIAHRMIGNRSYKIRIYPSISTIKRNTFSDRLQQIDDILVELLIALQDTNVKYYRNIELDKLRNHIKESNIVILDEAVSDGTTTLDLARRIANEKRIKSARIRIYGSDIAHQFYVINDSTSSEERLAVFDTFGELRQLKIKSDSCNNDFFINTPALIRQKKNELELKFANLTEQKRNVSAIFWINPEAREYAEQHPDNLSFVSHDLFKPFPKTVHIIRAFGILYNKLHEDADAYSYFDFAGIVKGLTSIGNNLVPGGVVIAGNVIDAVVPEKNYIDFEIRQKVTRESKKTSILKICEIKGLGLGISDEDICLFS